MLVLISPSKTMNAHTEYQQSEPTWPVFGKEADNLVKLLRKMDLEEISTFLKVSPTIGALNYQRYQNFSKNIKDGALHPAALSYSGEVYTGLNADQWDEKLFDDAQHNLRILSGLYGYLRPKDLIQPYRLEMAAKLCIANHTNLYQFWRQKITTAIQVDLTEMKDPIIFNLASDEYSKAIDSKSIKASFITFEFYEMRQGVKTFVSFSAKRARGLMANYIISQQLSTIQAVKEFDVEGYQFDAQNSSESNLVFIK